MSSKKTTRKKSIKKKKNHIGGGITASYFRHIVKKKAAYYDIMFQEAIFRMKIGDNLIELSYEPNDSTTKTFKYFTLILNDKTNSLYIFELNLHEFPIIENKNISKTFSDLHQVLMDLIDNITILLKCNKLMIDFSNHKFITYGKEKDDEFARILTENGLYYSHYGFLLNNNIVAENNLYQNKIIPFQNIIISELSNTETIGNIQNPFWNNYINNIKLKNKAFDLLIEMHKMCKDTDLYPNNTTIQTLYSRWFGMYMSYGLDSLDPKKTEIFKKHLEKLKPILYHMFNIHKSYYMTKMIIFDNNKYKTSKKNMFKGTKFIMTPINNDLLENMTIEEKQ